MDLIYSSRIKTEKGHPITIIRNLESSQNLIQHKMSWILLYQSSQLEKISDIKKERGLIFERGRKKVFARIVRRRGRPYSSRLLRES